ncbi:MAG: ATP-binding protein [Natronospirillum sp.]|uniref:sensor histidine kinase n=1 Tax=Natronospirillum sp. TaxID=2812955 RepID=UPI0025D1B494|nr:ATP-binding protein [Natronospirillum sp.]MCH8551211.1 ATP-binding protein [Natronospirillum sp.]
MTLPESEADTPRPVHLPRPAFPIWSALTLLVLVCALLFQADPINAEFYRVPVEVSQWLGTPESLYIAAGTLLLALLVDTRRHARRKRALRAAVEQLEAENRDLWQHRRELRLQAQTYSGHADRLKRFISDKLLEYIEYDEKFLHFQSIAAEVRHNGVIAFDRVQTALAQRAGQLEGDSANTEDAMAQMRYLWDLLDLATTDNLALHIGSQQARCEERYYQQLLNPEQTEPVVTAYYPREAIWLAARPLLHESSVTPDLRAAMTSNDRTLVLETDPQIALRLAPTEQLLGKSNHLALLLDNLLKNAQFYAHKKAYRHRHNRVRLLLEEREGFVRLQVYNRGPHIPESEQARIFQLGYSTRRVREHHGKGLGLFFVQEIVRGYDGRILVHNEDNRLSTDAQDKAVWHFRFTLSNGDLVHETVQVQLEDGAPQVLASLDRDGQPQFERQQSWSLRRPVSAVEVRHETTGEAHTLVPENTDGEDHPAVLFDPIQPDLPGWVLEIHPRKRGCRIVFEPLDVRGVTFEVLLPTAESRLDSSEPDLELPDIDDEVERLNQPFAAAQPEGYR